MRPPSYMWSVVDRNVVMRRMTAFCQYVNWLKRDISEDCWRLA